MLDFGNVVPDIDGFISLLKRKVMPKRVYHAEIFLDEEIRVALCKRFEIDKNVDYNKPHAKTKRDLLLMQYLGYDSFMIPVTWDIFKSELVTRDTTAIKDQNRGQRTWIDEKNGPIKNWGDFEKYPWPKLEDVNFSPLEWADKNLPENMGCYDLTAHVLEAVTFMFGFESFCYKIYDQPDLVDAVCEKIGQFYLDYTDALCDFDRVKHVWATDDMGFRSGTLVGASWISEKILPWHKKCAKAAHDKGKLYLFHSCGEISKIIDELIDDVKIDARHSFEDVILPVNQAKKEIGDRISLIGGIDMDFLCRSDESAIRKRVLETLEDCMPGGGYCLGTGNTVANYVPLDNYLVMLDEGNKFKV